MRSIEVMRWLQNVSYQLLRYPYYSNQFIRDTIQARSDGCGRAELEQYEKFSRDYTGRRLILTSLHLVAALRHLSYVFFTMSSVDFIDTETNFAIVERPTLDSPTFQTQQGHLKFLCLGTNCSRLSNPGSIARALEGQGPSLINTYDPAHDERTRDPRVRLADDLARLPLFALCRSKWWHMTSPLVYMHISGIVSGLIYSLYVIFMCILVPLYSTLVPGMLPHTMSVLCPRTNLKLFAQRLGKHQEALLRSQLYYVSRCEGICQLQVAGKMAVKPRPFLPPSSRAILRNSRKNIVQISGRLNSLVKNAGNFELEAAPQRPDSLPKSHFEHLVADCLPIEFTNWFRINWVRAQALTVLGLLMNALICLSTVIATSALDETYPTIYRSYAQVMEADHCALWKTITGWAEPISVLEFD